MAQRVVAACFVAFVAMAACLSGGAQVPAAQETFQASRDHRAIQYTARPTTDPIGRLNRRLSNDEVRLTFDRTSGYLKSVIDLLKVPVESQLFVFARSSLQADRISPTNPRSVFFGDDVAVAWPRGGFIEAASVDPKQGVIFYRLQQAPASSPAFVRSDEVCLVCHAIPATLGVPGLAVASVVPDAGGFVTDVQPAIMDHRMPIAERWGGWYVTAKHQPMSHRGNLMAPNGDRPALTPTPASIELPTLTGAFDTRGYLSAQSDVVAHLVLDHQTRMINLLTRLGWETRVALADRPSAAGERVHDLAREVVDYMLFVDEAPLKGPIEGGSGFAARFEALGPRDRRGRSLRDLDLRTRLLRYPCSYLIYSEQFDQLPAEAREAVSARLKEVLTGADKAARYDRLSAADRRAIVEILADTKKGVL
jgi:hypothetical protein